MVQTTGTLQPTPSAPVAAVATPQSKADATKYLFSGPIPPTKDSNIDYDLGPLADTRGLNVLATAGAPAASAPELQLLPVDYKWRETPTARLRVPLPLCEFLAYKCGLAYKMRREIQQNLGPARENFQFFDTTKGGDKIAADTQGYGFTYQGIAFIIMRGSQEDADWETNFLDTMTHDLGRTKAGTFIVPGADRLKRLTVPDGVELNRLIGNQDPGRHVGFAIAWGAVRPQIEDWIAASKFPDDMRYVFSGHSLGGALALIGAYELASGFRGGGVRRNVAAVVTFGAPTVGNEDFLKCYNTELGDRTVRIEATADIVPVIMRRWYYRLDQKRRDLLRTRMSLAALHDADDRFAPVGAGWRFPQQPPLTLADFNAVVQAQLAAMARQEKAREEAERKKQEDAAKQGAQPNGGSQPKPAGGSASASTTGSATAAEAAAKAERDRLTVAVIWAGVAAAIGLVVWIGIVIFKKRKVAAHAIIEHYALFISTLSYQQIRKLRTGDLALANQDLERYLRFIRGVDGSGGYFEPYAKIPLPLEPDYDLTNFVARNPETNMV